jgi:hypothetical protein
MTDEPFKRLPRAEEKKRYALQRAIPREMRTVAKGTAWRCAQGVLFREHEGWFVECSTIAWISDYKTQAQFTIKPMALDPLFWDIVAVPENRKQPLSFRSFGAWTCRPPAIAESFIDEDDGNAVGIARRAKEWADEKLADFDGRWDYDAFLQMLRREPGGGGYVGPDASLICMLILMGKDEEAISMCRGMVERGDSGGFVIVGGAPGTFPELAIRWITDPQRVGTRH